MSAIGAGTPGRKRAPFGWNPSCDARVEYEPTTGCWLWTGRLDKCGYGLVAFGGRKENGGRSYQAHRVAFTSLNGPIPEGMVVCHRRDTPACCSPNHLFVGTQAENMADRDRKGRGWFKLTEAQVADIRLCATSAAELAKWYGVSESLIYGIRAGTKRPKSELIESLLREKELECL